MTTARGGGRDSNPARRAAKRTKSGIVGRSLKFQKTTPLNEEHVPCAQCLFQGWTWAHARAFPSSSSVAVGSIRTLRNGGSVGSLDSAGEFNACRSVGRPLAALPLSSLLPALRTFPSPTNQQMALHPLRPPHSTWIQSGALTTTDVLEPLFSLKNLRLHIGARIKRQLHPKENKTTEYLASHRLFPATTTCPRFIYGNAPSRRERERAAM